MNCPFCGCDPYEYVDVGVGGRGVPVAVMCCEFGQMLFDDRSEDQRWFRLAEKTLEQIEDIDDIEARMQKAADYIQNTIANDDWADHLQDKHDGDSEK